LQPGAVGALHWAFCKSRGKLGLLANERLQRLADGRLAYKQLYLVCYSITNFSIHATLASAARWEGAGNSESEADVEA